MQPYMTLRVIVAVVLVVTDMEVMYLKPLEDAEVNTALSFKKCMNSHD
jgi:hypothetical protein